MRRTGTIPMNPFIRPALVLFLITSPLFAVEKPEGPSGMDEIVRMLSAGNQTAAEAKLGEILAGNPEDASAVFWSAVCERSRFNQKGAAPGFIKTMSGHPNSPEGLASACVLGIDVSTDQATALYYYNALLVLGRQNPKSIPLRWLAAIMSREITKNDPLQESSERYKRILMCGIREYEAVLSLMAPGTGPVLLHQTLANLLDAAEGPDAAWKHRETALKMTRATWTLQGAANTLRRLERNEEALQFLQEAIALQPNNPDYFHAQGNALSNLGRKKEAIESWDRASRLNPRNLVYLKLCALGERDLGDYAAARRYTRKALSINPGDRSFQIWDARFAANLGEPEAGALVAKVGFFDFRGNPVYPKNPPAESTPDPWFLAVENGDFARVRQLMGTVDINAGDPRHSRITPLMSAACMGWEQMASDLIKAGAKLDIVDENGDTALHYSAQFVQPRVMRLLLDAGANPNIQDKWKQTPLTMCASEHRRDGFYLLMEKKVDIELATPHGGTALHYAAGHGELAMLNTLLASGARVNTPTENTGETPLIAACDDWPHSPIVTPLLAAGADVNARNKDGRTALHCAVNPLLNIPLVEALLEKGANPALADKEGITPIAEARLLGFEDIAQKMEQKAGAPEPFQFPKFEAPDPSLSTEEKNASVYVFPILLAQGHPLGRASGVRMGEKNAARKELKWMFEIENAGQLKDEIRELEAFEPRHRDDAGTLPPDVSVKVLGGTLANLAKNIHASCSRDVPDETAWIKSHIIYLADLGVAAGFLEPAEGEKLIRSASAAVKAKYASWPDYVRSFLLGAQFHNAWEADRYEQICNRILEAKIPWP